MITANELNTRGIACLEENLQQYTEAMITVEGKECFVVMRVEQHHYLRNPRSCSVRYRSTQPTN